MPCQKSMFQECLPYLLTLGAFEHRVPRAVITEKVRGAAAKEAGVSPRW